MDEKFQDAVVALGALVMQYATVHRITFLADGVTPESDTDHTVMVGLISCAVAQQLEPRLDIGLVAQFSLVHDLVEAYAGDTNTFGGLSAGAHADKEARESAALARIQTELTDQLPWVSETIRAYESLSTPEARFVKTMDKIMPKITRLVNKEKTGWSAEDFDAHVAQQTEKMKTTYGHDQDVAISLYDVLVRGVSSHLHSVQENTTEPEAS